MFRDAIFAAASEVGADGTGTDGLKGYLRKIANEDPKTCPSSGNLRQMAG